MTACPAETAPETHRPQAHEEQHPWPQLIERPGLEAAPGERKKYDIDGNRASFEFVSDTLALTGRRIAERAAASQRHQHRIQAQEPDRLPDDEGRHDQNPGKLTVDDAEILSDRKGPM